MDYNKFLEILNPRLRAQLRAYVVRMLFVCIIQKVPGWYCCNFEHCLEGRCYELYNMFIRFGLMMTSQLRTYVVYNKFLEILNPRLRTHVVRMLFVWIIQKVPGWYCCNFEHCLEGRCYELYNMFIHFGLMMTSQLRTYVVQKRLLAYNSKSYSPILM